MNFESSFELLNLIERLENNLKRNFFINVLIIIGFSLLMYYSLNRILDSVFYISEALLILIIGIIDRSKSVSTGLIASKTAVEISVFEEEIIVKTAPFKVLFWINKPSVELKFKVHEFASKKVLYPVKAIYDLDTPVWQLINDKSEIYIIPNLFNNRIDEELLRLLTK